MSCSWGPVCRGASSAGVAALIAMLTSVGCDPAPAEVDAGTTPSTDATTPRMDGGAEVTPCASDEECVDAIYCDGAEYCDPSDADGDARGCVEGAPPCAVGELCDEALDACTPDCGAPPDADGDGHYSIECGGDDCDDADPNTFPGNVEVCDGDAHDEDCNPETFGFVDADGDGSGANVCCNVGPSGDLLCGTDCNDADGAVNPREGDGPPLYCDGVDNDCDGVPDEGCPCTEGSDRACGTEPQLMRIGICRPGNQICSGGAWTATCSGAVDAGEEVCDALDNDCDGTTDEAVLRTYYRDADGDGFGTLGETTSACSPPAGWAPDNRDCDDDVASINPTAIELCNGADDDCDTSTDEGVRGLFYADTDGDGFGDIGASMEACTRPSGYVTDSTDCDDTVRTVNPPAAEVCDGVDNNCDSDVDLGCSCTDGSTQPCGSSELGECQRGTQRCQGGSWGECIGAIEPRTETCNGLDDDCDGVPDEGVTRTYYLDSDGDGFGTLASTIEACATPAGYSDVATDCDDGVAAVNPAAVERCNGVDDDCAGGVDAGCSCIDGETRACGASDGEGGILDEGECTAGTQRCFDGLWGECVGAVAPRSESCNVLDDDCDGDVDEGVQTTFYGDGDGDGFGDPGSPTLACSLPGWHSALGTDCADANAAVSPAAPERCNGIDDNCAGGVDEGCECTDGATRACGPPDGAGGVLTTGECAAGTQRCQGGLWGECVGAVAPRPESCNTLDDDCDGLVDDGVQSTFYADADGDGFGGPTVTTLACAPPAGHSALGTDCHDGDAAISPASPERCNGVDDNCAGGVDEGCDCTDGATRACGAPDGSGGILETGECTAGVQLCVAGTWGGCVGAIGPRAELCNALDDDCDGADDEGVLSTYHRDEDGDGYGVPGETLSACGAPDGWTLDATDCDDAVGATHPGAIEVCNGVDDDCDTLTDEGVLDPFYRDADGDGFGDVATSVEACNRPSGFVIDATDCDDTVRAINPPAAEICDGIDNNCDGDVDAGCTCTDGVTRACGSSDVGECAFGTQRCQGGLWGECVGAIEPRAETCNDLDDDCDGPVDDGVVRTYYRDVDGDGFGASALPFQACDLPVGYALSSTDCDDGAAAINPAAVERCNGVDDNCAGGVDEGCDCTDGATRGCGTPDGAGGYLTTGECAAGTQRCQGGLWGECVGAVAPRAESCNGLDDDCDGLEDEGVKSTFYADDDGDGFGDAADAQLACALPAGHSGLGTDCNDGNAAISPASPERCNGVDDNCAGGVDEGCDCTDGATRGCGTSDGAGGFIETGECTVGAQQCVAGAWGGCVGATAPRTELCNNLDDDCDGGVDEGTRASCYTDGDGDGYGTGALRSVCEGAGGGCPAGFAALSGDCNDGVASIRPSAAEVCNDLDDDCDGVVDDGVRIGCYEDRDGDSYGFGPPQPICPGSGGFFSCPSGYTGRASPVDCNDGAASVHPGAREECNGISDDCDAATDEGTQITCWEDRDGDTYGFGPSQSICPTSGGACPSGYASRSGDCQDNDPLVRPLIAERCNGISDDCDSTVDSDHASYACAQGSTQFCTTACGTLGRRECTNACQWLNPTCSAQQETCNYCDDDADGTHYDDGYLASGRVTRRVECAQVTLAGLDPSCTDDGFLGTAATLIHDTHEDAGAAWITGTYTVGYQSLTIGPINVVPSSSTVYPGRGWALVIADDAPGSLVGSTQHALGVPYTRSGLAIEWRFYTGTDVTNEIDTVTTRRLTGLAAGTVLETDTVPASERFDVGSSNVIQQLTVRYTPPDPLAGITTPRLEVWIGNPDSGQRIVNRTSGMPTWEPGTNLRIGITAASSSAYRSTIFWLPAIYPVEQQGVCL